MRIEDLEELVRIRTRELTETNVKLHEEAAARELMEAELRLSQKLEAVGQLASGIAHEINTPMQYIGDNVEFLRESFQDLQALLDRYKEIHKALAGNGGNSELLREANEAEQEADIGYLEEHIPNALQLTLEGVKRVTELVLSMKEFSHPQCQDKTPVDINGAIRNTLTVARNEYKYVAEVQTDLGDLPHIMCLGGDMNQVFLNLVINAAHAIAEVVEEGKEKGRISIRTAKADDKTVLIAVSDTGCGIPEEIRQRVFDPFFTTKDVGHGSGQGLYIARSVVVDKHGGSLMVESEVGRGTTFKILLPIGES